MTTQPHDTGGSGSSPAMLLYVDEFPPSNHHGGAILLKRLLDQYPAHCLTVIASRIGGLPYVVEEGKSGLLFEAGNAADLADKVRRLRANPSEVEAMGQCGRQLAETEYGPQKSYDNLMQIFTQVLSAR